MAASFPYTHYACPCSDLTTDPVTVTSKRASILQPPTIQLSEDRTFNPHDPRANYTLYPLDQLLYCDECDAISCPRCWTEEVLYWYCPSCLFEVPSSTVKGDGNRCSRSCYNCPSCTSPLSIVALPSPNDGFLKPSDAPGGAESYIMQCAYCEWSSLDIDVSFNKPTKITEQLAKQRKARWSVPKQDTEPSDATSTRSLDHDHMFANLSNFYKEQLSETSDPQNPFSNSPYSSPANLARIMSLYGGLSHNALKKSRERPQPMREAMERGEGLAAFTKEEGLEAGRGMIDKLEAVGWGGTSTREQRLSAPVNNEAKLTDELWPTAALLRTRRGKRCRTCRQFLARPEPKVSSMRYRIRLLALNFLPRLSLRRLHPTAPPTNPSFRLRNEVSEEPALKPLELKQYVLTIRNPIFENVQITLATPATTPGRIASRVTILCPSFPVGPAGDVWDEALSASQPATTSVSSDGSRRAAMASLTGANDAERQPEAGKIWERTRNSTSVIVEIVPGRNTESAPRAVSTVPDDGEDEEDEEGEDDDVLEVPVYVRAEWEVEVKEGESSMGKKDVERRPGEKVKKELGYWVVLGVGRIVA